MSEYSSGDVADLILRGGRIRTFDASAPLVDAIAVRDGRIIAHGADVRSLAAREIVELDGCTAIPGINDAHLHAAWLGARWPHLFFSDTPAEEQPTGRLLHDDLDRRRALQSAWRLLAEHGITSYTEPGIGPGEDEGETGCFGSAMLQTYVDLHREGAQTSRVTLLRLFGTIDGESVLDDFKRGIRLPAPATDARWLSVSGVKIFADGIPPMATAWVHEPYADGTSGELLTRGSTDPLTAFRTMIMQAVQQGLQVAVHATGDRSIDEFIRALESVTDAPPPSGPHYVVHGDLATHEQLQRMRELGAGFAVQPLIADHTHAWAGMQLGAERTALAWPLDAMLETGVLTTITSDAPIASPDWRTSIDASIALVGRDDAATREALLHRMTVSPAEQDGASAWKGTLGLGKVADITVLDEDIIEPGRTAASIRVARTIVDGRTVYAATP